MSVSQLGMSWTLGTFTFGDTCILGKPQLHSKYAKQVGLNSGDTQTASVTYNATKPGDTSGFLERCICKAAIPVSPRGLGTTLT